MWVRSLNQEDPLERGMATHSSILAWRIPWAEESGRLWSIGLQRVGHDWRYLACTHVDNEITFWKWSDWISVFLTGDLLVCAKYYSRVIGLMLLMLIWSQSLCNNNGRCVWKTAESSTCLHMPENSSKKYSLNKSLRVIISLVNKLKTIKNMKDGFVWHCCYYHGWCRDSCQRHSSDVLRGKNKAPMAKFKLSVFLSTTLSVILLIVFHPLWHVHFSLKYWRVENANFFNFNLLLKYLFPLKFKKQVIIGSMHW